MNFDLALIVKILTKEEKQRHSSKVRVSKHIKEKEIKGIDYSSK